MKIERLKVVDDGSIQLREGDTWHKDPKKTCMSCYAEVGQFHSKDCRYQLEAAWAVWAPPVDLRPICRDSDRCEARVYLMPERFRPSFQHQWIILGQTSLDRRNEGSHEHTLRAYLGRGATDFEHDSAYAIQLSLYGVVFEQVTYHTTVITAFIAPDIRIDDFRVPPPGYNPFELPDTEMCDDERCKPHPIVPEGHYVPKGNPELMKLVRGKRVKVYIGPARKERS